MTAGETGQIKTAVPRMQALTLKACRPTRMAIRYDNKWQSKCWITFSPCLHFTKLQQFGSLTKYTVPDVSLDLCSVNVRTVLSRSFSEAGILSWIGSDDILNCL